MICIYHGNCFDGWTAAWIVKKEFPDAILHRGTYDGTTDVPDVKGQDVLMVDFTYPRHVMEKILADAKTLLVLDHHKTAEENLIGLPKKNFIFDMKRSGATITWDHFHSASEPRPWLVDYIEDRDIWNKALPHTDIIHGFIASHKRNMENWDMMAALPFEKALESGQHIHRFMEQYISAVSNEARVVKFLGCRVAVVNCPYLMCSEIGHNLCKMFEVRFSLSWYQGSTGQFMYSLRSIGDFDVSKVARKFGGGGHKNASGFSHQLPFDELQSEYHFSRIEEEA